MLIVQSSYHKQVLYSIPNLSIISFVVRMDLIPFYSRLVATLHPCVEDVALLLVDMVVREFRYQVKKKDQIHIQSKLKNVRFIGKVGCA